MVTPTHWLQLGAVAVCAQKRLESYQPVSTVTGMSARSCDAAQSPSQTQSFSMCNQYSVGSMGSMQGEQRLPHAQHRLLTASWT